MRDLEPSAESVLTQHAPGITDSERLQLRIRGDSSLPTLIHLPGLHGDWTLLGPFRAALGGRARLVESTYPRRLDWSLNDYAGAIESALLEHGITSGWILGESFSSLVAWQFLARQRPDPSPKDTGGTLKGTSSPRPSPPSGGGEGARRAGEEAITCEKTDSYSRLASHDRAAAFNVTGLILVGGFIRHSWPWAVRLAHSASGAISLKLLRHLCKFYGRTARRRYCDCPDAVAELDEFVERRTNEPDRQVITCRYRLISQNDPRSIACNTTLPVYQLSGAWDPIVPWWQVRPWLRRHCPGYHASRIIRSGGHNVLLSAPRKSADQIMDWVCGSAK